MRIFSLSDVSHSQTTGIPLCQEIDYGIFSLSLWTIQYLESVRKLSGVSSLCDTKKPASL